MWVQSGDPETFGATVLAEKVGGPRRIRTCDPLIKSSPEDQTEQTQEDLSRQKNEHLE